MTAAAAGGTGKYSYEISYKKASEEKWAVKQKFGSNQTLDIKPAAAVAYDVKVRVKDSSGTITEKLFTVNVAPNLQNTSAVSSASIKLGEKVTVNASGTGGKGPYTYEISYKKTSDSKWAVKQSFSDNQTLDIKPAAKTSYTVKVRIKDSEGTIVGKNFTVKVS